MKHVHPAVLIKLKEIKPVVERVYSLDKEIEEDDVRYYCLIYDVEYERYEEVLKEIFFAKNHIPESERKRIKDQIRSLEKDIHDLHDDIDQKEMEIGELEAEIEEGKSRNKSQTDIYQIIALNS